MFRISNNVSLSRPRAVRTAKSNVDSKCLRCRTVLAKCSIIYRYTPTLPVCVHLFSRHRIRQRFLLRKQTTCVWCWKNNGAPESDTVREGRRKRKFKHIRPRFTLLFTTVTSAFLDFACICLSAVIFFCSFSNRFALLCRLHSRWRLMWIIFV